MRNWVTLGAVTALAVGAVALAGCGSTAGTGTTAGDTSATPTTPEISGAVTVAGSDTMVNMSQAWAEEFMKANPGVQIAVKGGGSGTGIAALINGTVDFANASRELKDEEKAKLAGAVENKVARDGIAVVVNSANKVENLTKDQLGKIYRGEVTNWKAVGGADKPIVLISRDPSSGTYEYFKEEIVGKEKNYAKSAKLLPSTQAIVDEVKANADAIGYIGVGYESTDIKVVGLEGVKASVATVLDGTYPLSRGLYMYSNGAPSEAGKAFLDWILSAAGQKVVTDQGFVPVN
ncbi:MAG: phosphate ABC transporter substrate-binding protein [Coriobacteriia bacterium]|nr:phosphate ABC transporter substrate-binding protein [Coriobacteriia bacterium]